MAVFGAPITLEDHAFRACLAALDIQEEVGIVAAEVKRLNGITLQPRIGLNSGQVIAGEIGSNTASYTTIGEQVGVAQRMESSSPPGCDAQRVHGTTSSRERRGAGRVRIGAH